MLASLYSASHRLQQYSINPHNGLTHGLSASPSLLWVSTIANGYTLVCLSALRIPSLNRALHRISPSLSQRSTLTHFQFTLYRSWLALRAHSWSQSLTLYVFLIQLYLLDWIHFSFRQQFAHIVNRYALLVYSLSSTIFNSPHFANGYTISSITRQQFLFLLLFSLKFLLYLFIVDSPFLNTSLSFQGEQFLS